MGRSLGTGVAVQVAAKRLVKAMVLVSPYDSIAEVAAATYPWLPVRWLVRHPFDSMAHAAAIKVPALIVTGSADTLIRPAHSKRLAKLWGGPVETLELEGQGHNDIGGERYEAAIRAFLDRHL
jgi:pimeloyl-ACP methyl ester carboxylesterase